MLKLSVIVPEMQTTKTTKKVTNFCNSSLSSKVLLVNYMKVIGKESTLRASILGP